MRDARGETPCYGELFRTPQRLLGALVLQELVTNLILALPATQRDLERTEQSLRTDGPFEKEHIPERPPQLTEPFALSRDLASDGQQDKREIGPGWLFIHDLEHLRDHGSA